MALIWPVPVDEFFDDLGVEQARFWVSVAKTQSITGGGDVIPHQLGARLWQGEVLLGKDFHAANAAIEARMSLLLEPGASLLIYDRRKPFPTADPGGSILGAAIPNIDSLNANNRELALNSLPPGYAISRGDLIGWTYGSNPVRYALHRVVGAAVAGGLGKTPQFEVTPFIRPGVVPGAAVTLVMPVLKAKFQKVENGSGRSNLSGGGTFTWLQTLR